MTTRCEEPEYPPIHCCEECRSFRRHEDGRGLCMAMMSGTADTSEQHSALAGTNARNRCRHYRLLHNDGDTRWRNAFLQGAGTRAAGGGWLACRDGMDERNRVLLPSVCQPAAWGLVAHRGLRAGGAACRRASTPPAGRRAQVPAERLNRPTGWTSVPAALHCNPETLQATALRSCSKAPGAPMPSATRRRPPPGQRKDVPPTPDDHLPPEVS